MDSVANDIDTMDILVKANIKVFPEFHEKMLREIYEGDYYTFNFRYSRS